MEQDRKTNSPYVAAEPDKVEAYQDQRGRLHPTRDLALEANFADDVDYAFADVFENDENRVMFGSLPVALVKVFVRAFIERHPDIVRVWLGDRDIT